MARFLDVHRRGDTTVAEVDRARLLLMLAAPVDRQEVSWRLRGIGVVVEGDQSSTGEPIHQGPSWLWVRAADGVLDDRLQERVGALVGESLERFGPVYRMRGTDGDRGLFAPLPDVLLIRLTGSEQQRQEFAERFGLTESDEDRAVADRLGAESYRRFKVRNLDDDAFRVNQAILDAAADEVVDVRYENMPLVSPFAMRLSDPLSDQQWNMDRIGAQSPVDQQISGWDYSLGDSSITIAVIDTGCDLTHPDLRIVAGFSVGDPAGMGGTRPVPGFAAGHGTFCAGVASAMAFNLKGLTGVAGRCRILPVAFDKCTDWEFLKALTHATEHGARVVSMSFSIFDDLWDTAVAGQAVHHASSRGVVLCAASGNKEQSGLSYPALDPRVIACGASTRGLPERRVSTANGFDWGSTYGSGLSVVAPGEQVPTTCVQGSGDGGVWGSDYVAGFHGTSAATPHVAGLAALLLSLRPSLTPDHVRRYIEVTADKIGPGAFTPGHPNGSWNQFVGYGRINVHHALRRALWPFDIVVHLDLHLRRLAAGMKAHQAEIERLEAECGDPAVIAVHRAWIRLGSDEAVLHLIRDLVQDPDLLFELRDEPRSFADARGIDLPPDSTVEVCLGPPELLVRFAVAGLTAVAGWNTETGFFGEVLDTAGAYQA